MNHTFYLNWLLGKNDVKERSIKEVDGRIIIDSFSYRYKSNMKIYKDIIQKIPKKYHKEFLKVFTYICTTYNCPEQIKTNLLLQRMQQVLKEKAYTHELYKLYELYKEKKIIYADCQFEIDLF